MYQALGQILRIVGLCTSSCQQKTHYCGCTGTGSCFDLDEVVVMRFIITWFCKNMQCKCEMNLDKMSKIRKFENLEISEFFVTIKFDFVLTLVFKVIIFL